MGKLKVMENLINLMEIYMKENGKTINKRERAKKFGQMALYMKGSFIMV